MIQMTMKRTYLCSSILSKRLRSLPTSSRVVGGTQGGPVQSTGKSNRFFKKRQILLVWIIAIDVKHLDYCTIRERQKFSNNWSGVLSLLFLLFWLFWLFLLFLLWCVVIYVRWWWLGNGVPCLLYRRFVHHS